MSDNGELRGKAIADKPNQIQRMDERFYKVASQNGRGMYDVIRRENGSWICNCLDYHYRVSELHQILRCKHVYEDCRVGFRDPIFL